MNGWKAATIILLIISILQMILIVWAWNYGTEIIEKKNECAYNICKDYESYYLDVDDVCSCYDDGEIVYEEYVR